MARRKKSNLLDFTAKASEQRLPGIHKINVRAGLTGFKIFTCKEEDSAILEINEKYWSCGTIAKASALIFQDTQAIDELIIQLRNCKAYLLEKRLSAVSAERQRLLSQSPIARQYELLDASENELIGKLERNAAGLRSTL